MRTITLLSLALLATACEDELVAPAPLAPAAAPAPAAARVDERDQYQLAHDVDEALSADLQADGPVLARTVRSWTGQRVSWELRYVPVLCPRADSCALAPFDHNRFEHRVVQGWLPMLELDDATHAELARRCDGIERCVVRVEAQVKKLALSPDEPTSVTLDRVAIADARGQRPDESWIVSNRPNAAPKAQRPAPTREERRDPG